ncbi:unnamed protein product [Paramecium pentaurelia]|uniref:Protein RER1 n=1 Tax=Paramecium pentaurelia TaxID=43138 RepID=A0A8S1VBU1_9CILI|nr:unnamed protein product [Paramecium pentaurelia]
MNSDVDPVYTRLYHKYTMKYRRIIDKWIMHPGKRWSLCALLLFFYFSRLVETQSYFVVSYMLGIQIIQSLLRYFTPLGLPDIEDEDEDVNIQLPQHTDDRPLIRSMPEIQLWEQIIFALFLSNFATYFQIFDLPVYWPFLFSYFILVMIITFKKYLKHMQKYGYSWGDFSKR